MKLKLNIKTCVLWVSCFCFSNSFAHLPDYSAPELIARANVQDGFNLPALTFLDNISPVINNKGDIAFKIMALGGANSQALWFKEASQSNGEVIYVAPDERFLTEPMSISESGKIAFNLYDEGVTDGIFVLDSRSKEAEQVIAPDELDIQFYTYPQILDSEHIVFRATNDANDRLVYDFDGDELEEVISEGDDSLGIKSSYLFKPATNENGQIVLKTRLGEKGHWDESNPDAIVMLSRPSNNSQEGYKLDTIARDRDADPNSPFIGFGNSVSVSNNGNVAFIGYLFPMKKSIVLARDKKLMTLTLEGQNSISEIEPFTPIVNDSGDIVFRAKDMEGKRGIYLASEAGVKRLIAEGDEVTTDIGAGKILSNPNYPGFGGDLDMNDHGEIVFHCLIVSPDDNKELGAAVYKIAPLK